MSNKITLFFKSPVKNTTEFAKESGRLMDACRKRFFCEKTPGMAEDFHEFAKHEAKKGRNRLATFYLAQEIRSLKACLKSCGKEEVPELKRRLYQAHWNHAALDFARGTIWSLNKTKRHCDAADNMLPLPGAATYMETAEASSLLHETIAKAQYLHVISNDYYHSEIKKACCKVACENMGIALDKLLSIERKLENQPAVNTRIGQIYFWLGELEFEVEGYYSAKKHYEDAMKRLPAGAYRDLAKSRLWDIEWHGRRSDEVAKHNKSIEGRYTEMTTYDALDGSAHYQWHDRESGGYVYTNPYLSYPSSPEPKYENEKLNLLSECPIKPKW